MDPNPPTSPFDDRVPPGPVWRRIGIRAAAVLPRPREEVWAEIADGRHPAWSDGGEDPWGLVKGSPVFGLGTRRVAPFTVGPPYGILTTLCSVITEFTEGWRYTTVTFAGSWEHTETLYLSEAAGGSHVDIHGWLSLATTDAGAAQQERRFTYLAQAFLDRAQRWQTGVPPQPIIVPRDV